MKTVLKYIIICMACILIISSLSYNGFADTSINLIGVNLATDQIVNGKDITIDKLTLDAAIDIALSDNLDIQQANLEISKNNISLNNQKKILDVDAVVDIPGMGFNNPYDIRLPQELTKVQLDQMPKINSQVKLLKEMETTFKVKEAYYQIIKALKTKELTDELVNISKEHLANVENKYNKGLTSAMEAMQAEIDMTSNQVNLYQANIFVDTSKLALNNILNVELDSEWEYEIPEVSQYEIPNSAELMAYALTNHPAILQAKISTDISKAELELNKSYYATNSSEYQITEKNYEIAKINQAKIEKQYEQNITSLLLNINNLQQRKKLLLKNKHLVEQNIEIAKLQYEMGITTTNQHNNALLGYLKANNDIIELDYDLDLAYAQLELASGYKLLELGFKIE